MQRCRAITRMVRHFQVAYKVSMNLALDVVVHKTPLASQVRPSVFLSAVEAYMLNSRRSSSIVEMIVLEVNLQRFGIVKLLLATSPVLTIDVIVLLNPNEDD